MKRQHTVTFAGVTMGAAFGAMSGYTPNMPSTPRYNLNGAKNAEYVNNCALNDDMINNAINNGKQGSSINMATGSMCTVYSYPGKDNQYVVIENSTRNLVQVSNFNDPDWILDKNIIWG